MSVATPVFTAHIAGSPGPAASAAPPSTPHDAGRLASIPIMKQGDVGPAECVLDRGALERIRSIQRPDRPDLVHRVLQIWLERSPAQVRAITDAAAAGDAHQLARAAHDLKGGSGNVGLVQIASLLARIERLAKQDQLAETGALLSQLPILHAAAATAVRGELERCPQTPEPDHA
jgi:HPt (histidine-containing phosphotransfer) domain-containing protein